MKTYKVTVNDEGTTRWYNEQDQLHNEHGPAIEWTSGTKSWWRNGKRHREDGPAIEFADGTKWWYLNDEQFTKEEFNIRKHTCDGKIVEIDGKKYKLQQL